MSNDKHPGGRPTKYRPEYCETVVELMKDGASKTEVCGTIGVCHDTLIEWQKKYPEFSEAVKKGVLLSSAWWEREGRQSLRDRDFSYTGWYMNMKNRFGWRDKIEADVNGSLKVEIVKFDNGEDTE